MSSLSQELAFYKLYILSPQVLMELVWLAGKVMKTMTTMVPKIRT